MGLTSRQLYYFVAIVKAGSLTHAAGLLHVAPTALSLQIKAMEDDFAVTLLRRHSRGIEVTPAGADLFARAQEIVARFEAAEAALRGAGAVMPRLIRLGAPPAIARLIGADAVFGAAARFPGVTFDLIQNWSATLERQLRLDELDVVIGYGLETDDTISAVPLHDDELVFAAAPALAGGAAPITLAAALTRDLVFYGANSVGWRATCAAAAEAGLTPPRENQVGSIELWRAMLCRGLGCTITSFAAISDEVARGEIAVRAITEPVIRRQIVIAFRPGLAGSAWTADYRVFIAELIKSAQSRLKDPAGLPAVPA